VSPTAISLMTGVVPAVIPSATLLTAGIAVLVLGWSGRGSSTGAAVFGSGLGAALTGLVLTGIAG
jgi:hypothetical protein